jgi:hypothetical protein
MMNASFYIKHAWEEGGSLLSYAAGGGVLVVEI